MSPLLKGLEALRRRVVDRQTAAAAAAGAHEASHYAAVPYVALHIYLRTYSFQRHFCLPNSFINPSLIWMCSVHAEGSLLASVVGHLQAESPRTARVVLGAAASRAHAVSGGMLRSQALPRGLRPAGGTSP